MNKRILALLVPLLLCLALPAQAEVRFENMQFDGHEIGVNLSVSSDKTPVYLVLDQITLNGLLFYESSSDFADSWLGYSNEDHSRSCSFTVPLDAGYVGPSIEDSASAFEALLRTFEQTGTLNVSFRVTVLEPLQQIEEVDRTFHGDSTTIWREIDAIVAQGDTPVESDEPYSVLTSSSALPYVRFDAPVGSFTGSVSVLQEYANMRPIEQRLICFSIHK